MTRRIIELAPGISQRDIATAAGFTNANYLSMIKSGATKVALDRIPALATALQTDPRHLYLLALEQHGFETQKAAVEAIFGTLVTENEVAWLEEIRAASGQSDPRLTKRARSALRAIFGQ
ncbi:helix-turn-helix domain-containing protein [Roseivivax sp. CAU 1761]